MMIDGKTCLLEKESDPTQLRSPSPGKLVNLLLENGDHVKAGEAYAEIEVRDDSGESRRKLMYFE
jgi:acetyl-CoA carboxylase/biotin carboxylase 1